jgi:hypothetical protein
MRKLVIAMAAVALVTAPAYAQSRGKGGKHSGAEQQSPDQKKKAAEAEAAYKNALKQIPDQKPGDPWSNMR